jgi:hypothetical protein
MFKKIKECSADKGDDSGSHCSTSNSFQVKQMLKKNVFNCQIYMLQFLWQKKKVKLSL